jgi:hypothetical protein
MVRQETAQSDYTRGSRTWMRSMNEEWPWCYRCRRCRMQRSGWQRRRAMGPSRGGLNGWRGKRKCGVGYGGESGAGAKSVQAGSSEKGRGGIKVKHLDSNRIDKYFPCSSSETWVKCAERNAREGARQEEGAKRYRCDRCARSFQEAFIFFRTSPGKRCSAQSRITRWETRA